MAFGLDKEFLDMTPKKQWSTKKFLNWTSLKLKLLYIKRYHSQMEDKSQNGRKYSNIYLIMGLYPEYIKISYNQH